MPILSTQLTGQGQTPDGTLVDIPPAAVLIQRGPCLQVTISLARSMAAQLIQQGQGVPTPRSGLALIDTGASSTCIDRSLAETMGLPVVDVVQMTSASEAFRDCNVYPVNIEIQSLPVPIEAPRALGAELAPQGIIALIGRDVLAQCTLHYNGVTGHFTIAI